MQLIMIRHAQSAANISGQLTGQIDSPLSDLGHIQAAAVAERLACEPIDCFYASDLQRAVLTAEAICSRQPGSRQPVQHGWLRERHGGVLQGLSKQQRKSHYPQLHAAWKSDDPNLPIQGGESRRQFQDRVIAGIKKLASQHRDDTIAVVAHAGVLLAMFSFVFNCPQNGNRLRCANTAICRFRFELDLWSMECWGDSAHLDQGSATMPALPREPSCPP
jgi:probable phosphoglycerate mutase